MDFWFCTSPNLTQADFWVSRIRRGKFQGRGKAPLPTFSAEKLSTGDFCGRSRCGARGTQKSSGKETEIGSENGPI